VEAEEKAAIKSGEMAEESTDQAQMLSLAYKVRCQG
jgi:hypothetical protein